MTNDSLIEKLIKESRAFRDSENAGMLHISKVIAIIRRHFNGKPAIEGKPLELQTRDELLAYIRNHTEDKLDMVKTPVVHSDEHWKKHAQQKMLDMVESFYNILAYRDAEIKELRTALSEDGKVMGDVSANDHRSVGLVTEPSPTKTETKIDEIKIVCDLIRSLFSYDEPPWFEIENVAKRIFSLRTTERNEP